MIMNSIMALSNVLIAADELEEPQTYNRNSSTEHGNKTLRSPSDNDERVCNDENKSNSSDQSHISHLWSAGMDFLTNITDQLSLDGEIFGAFSLDETHDQKRYKERYALLPWEELCEDTDTIYIHEDLREKILDLTKSPDAYFPKMIESDPNTLPVPTGIDFVNYTEMLRKMMSIDHHLASIHSKLAGRKLNEAFFWNTYLICIKKIQDEYFNEKDPNTKKSEDSKGWVNLRDKCLMRELQGIVVSTHGTVCYEDFVVV